MMAAEAVVLSGTFWVMAVTILGMVAAAMYDPAPVEMMGDHRKFVYG
jgi:hypothetical protein